MEEFYQTFESETNTFAHLTTPQLTKEWLQFSLKNLLNGLVGMIIPVQERFQTPNIIYDNSVECMQRLLECKQWIIDKKQAIESAGKAFPQAELDIVDDLALAVYEISKSCDEFEGPSGPHEAIDWVQHDTALGKYRDAMKKHARVLFNKRYPQVCFTVLISFGRCVFEGCGFQAPQRASAREAALDSMGQNGDLYMEYLTMWGITDLIL